MQLTELPAETLFEEKKVDPHVGGLRRWVHPNLGIAYLEFGLPKYGAACREVVQQLAHGIRTPSDSTDWSVALGQASSSPNLEDAPNKCPLMNSLHGWP